MHDGPAGVCSLRWAAQRPQHDAVVGARGATVSHPARPPAPWRTTARPTLARQTTWGGTVRQRLRTGQTQMPALPTGPARLASRRLRPCSPKRRSTGCGSSSPPAPEQFRPVPTPRTSSRWLGSASMSPPLRLAPSRCLTSLRDASGVRLGRGGGCRSLRAGRLPCTPSAHLFVSCACLFRGGVVSTAGAAGGGTRWSEPG